MLNESDAREIAKKEVERRGWQWEEPTEVIKRRRWLFASARVWEVRTNAGGIGRNAIVVIDEAGRVLKASWLPR